MLFLESISVIVVVFFFFFFKQKTAYEMRISDWSSDVCSSDLQMLLPWCERIALNLTQAIEIHPGALPQVPHRDQDMWEGPTGGLEYLVNVMWPLNTFTRENGGPRLSTPRHFHQDVPAQPQEAAVVPTEAPGAAQKRSATSQAGK